MLVYPYRKNSATDETDGLQITMTPEKMADINQLMTDAGKARKPKFMLPGGNVMLVILDADKFQHIVSHHMLTLDIDIFAGWFQELQKKRVKKVIVRTLDGRNHPGE